MGLGNSMPTEEKPTRVAAPFSAAELDAIDAWGFARRMRNRTDVIRELIKLGLEGAPNEAS